MIPASLALTDAWSLNRHALAEPATAEPSVVAVYHNSGAFAALKADGSVVTWGDSSYGGDSTALAKLLSSGVVQIFSTYTAFAALKADGSVVSWGDPNAGGDSRQVAELLASGVSQVISTAYAFAALKAEGSVVTWGSAGELSSGLAAGVIQLFASSDAFAALKADGSVVTWGASNSGGDSRAVATQLSSGVLQIVASSDAFAALKADGSVVTWGYSLSGGNSRHVAEQLSHDVVQIVSSYDAFAALKVDGSVVTWGNSRYGGDSHSVAEQLGNGVLNITSSGSAFAALKVDGSVVTWGSHSHGGNSSAVAEQLSSGVLQVLSSGSIFTALKADGSSVSWGANHGSSNALPSPLGHTGLQLLANGSAFAGLRAENWNSGGYASNSIIVASLLASVIMALDDVPTPSADDALSNRMPILAVPAGIQKGLSIGQATALPDFLVADADGDSLRLTLTAHNGQLGNLTDADPEAPGIQLIGSAAEINAALADATFTASAAGMARINFSLSDGKGVAPVTASYHLSAGLMAINHAPVFNIPEDGFQTSLVIGPVISLPSLMLADSDGDTLTLTLITTNGHLDNLSDADTQLAGVQLSGSATEINLALAEGSFTSLETGLSSIEFRLTDGQSNPVVITQTLISSDAAPEELFVTLHNGAVTTVDAGVGDDVYRMSDFVLSGPMAFILNDTQGHNSLQLEEGLQILSSRASSSTLELTLENGTTLTVAAADHFTYNLAEPQAKGFSNAGVGYEVFVQEVLGITLPSSPVIAVGDSVQVTAIGLSGVAEAPVVALPLV